MKTVSGIYSPSAGQMVVLDRAAQDLSIEANSEATVLLTSGRPVEETIASHGPFVMNTQQEILQLVDEFNNSKFGQMVSA